MSEINPYRAPSSETTETRAIVRRLRWPFIANVVAFVAIAGSQGWFSKYFVTYGIALPIPTMLALGPFLPVCLAIVLTVRGVTHLAGKSQSLNGVWECVELIIAGTVTGFYMIALYLPNVTVIWHLV